MCMFPLLLLPFDRTWAYILSMNEHDHIQFDTTLHIRSSLIGEDVAQPYIENRPHYSDAIMGAIASQITSLTIVYSTVYSDADQIKHQSSPVSRKMFPFDDVMMPNFPNVVIQEF